jgi:hypothetical protein
MENYGLLFKKPMPILSKIDSLNYACIGKEKIAIQKNMQIKLL